MILISSVKIRIGRPLPSELGPEVANQQIPVAADTATVRLVVMPVVFGEGHKRHVALELVNTRKT